jgi:hypothetical protein
MGTDIHGGFELRSPDGKWQALNDYEFPSRQNYNVFSILADVRNGRGFAGIKTSEGFNPIAEPRGLPEDVHMETLEKLSDCHTPSWLLLKEVFEYDYSQATIITGVVQWSYYLKFKESVNRYNPRWDRSHPQPEAWCGFASGGGIRIIEENEVAFVQANADTSELYVRTQWPRTYMDCMGDFLNDLQPLIKYCLDNVRLVFDFDS